MIREDHIVEWRRNAPWTEVSQVEQDLVISRALVEIYTVPELRESLAFRGGTALNKLYFDPPARYSEDIDLVQIRGEPIGPTIKAMTSVLDPWLGKPQWRKKHSRFTLNYRFESDDAPSGRSKLKIEINTREHFAHFGFIKKPFKMDSPWFKGEASITTYELDELMGTKLRALYQRRKGRDLFDMDLALRQPGIDPQRVMEAFQHYLSREGTTITRKQFEDNLALKLGMSQYVGDAIPLLAEGCHWDIDEAVANVSAQLVTRFPEHPLKGNDDLDGYSP